MIVVFYENTEHPLHFWLIKLEDMIPPGLGIRFSESTSDGHKCCLRSKWNHHIKILDYEIVEADGQKIPVFE